MKEDLLDMQTFQVYTEEPEELKAQNNKKTDNKQNNKQNSKPIENKQESSNSVETINTIESQKIKNTLTFVAVFFGVLFLIIGLDILNSLKII